MLFLKIKSEELMYFLILPPKEVSVPESNKRTLCSNLSKKNVWRQQREEVKGKGREDKKGKERGRAEEAIQSERTGSYVAPAVLR